jgi:hypothetical protein
MRKELQRRRNLCVMFVCVQRSCAHPVKVGLRTILSEKPLKSGVSSVYYSKLLYKCTRIGTFVQVLA